MVKPEALITAFAIFLVLVLALASLVEADAKSSSPKRTRALVISLTPKSDTDSKVSVFFIGKLF
jgi:hypothetical protein